MATLRLDRPRALNALTFEVYRELTDTFRALAGRARRARGRASPARAAPSAPAATCKRDHRRRCSQRDADGAARVHAHDLRPRPRHARAAAADRGLAQRHRGRRGRRPSPSPPTSGSPRTRAKIAFLFVKVGPRRRGHGRGPPAAAHRRARARHRAAHDRRLHRRRGGAAHRPLQPRGARPTSWPAETAALADRLARGPAGGARRHQGRARRARCTWTSKPRSTTRRASRPS